MLNIKKINKQSKLTARYREVGYPVSGGKIGQDNPIAFQHKNNSIIIKIYQKH